MPTSTKTEMSNNFVSWVNLLMPLTNSEKERLFGAFMYVLSCFWDISGIPRVQNEAIQEHIRDHIGVIYALSTIKTGVSQTCIELGFIIETILPDDDVEEIVPDDNQSIQVKPIKLIAVSWIIYSHFRRLYRYDNRMNSNNENSTTWQEIDNSTLAKWLKLNAEFLYSNTDDIVENGSSS